jgi:hypothetical protein
MSLKARGLAKHGSLLGWMVESDPAGCVRLALTDHATCLGLRLIYF